MKYTTPAHYQLKSSGATFPWPAVDSPTRGTYVDGETTLLRLDKDRYMACDNGSVRAFVIIPDDQVTKTREAHGILEAVAGA